VAGFDLAGWYGVLAPAGTPKAVIDRLYDEFRKAINAADMKERYVTFGLEPVEARRAVRCIHAGGTREVGRHRQALRHQTRLAA